ncbi:hypothetical protein JMJ76_0007127, partial [Colletotrichum scovillei]
ICSRLLREKKEGKKRDASGWPQQKEERKDPAPPARPSFLPLPQPRHARFH